MNSLQPFRPVYLLACLAMHLSGSRTGAAQTDGAVPLRGMQTITADLATKKFDQTLPFHEWFWLASPIPEAADSLSIECNSVTQNESGELVFGSSCGRAGTRSRRVVDPTSLVMPVKPLDPKLHYLFRFIAWKFATDSVTTRIDTLADTIRIVADAPATLANHFDADFGVLQSPRAGYWAVVTNAHYYLVPINKNEDLSRLTLGQRLQRRVSVFAGLSVQEIASRKEIHSLWDGVGSPVLGLGYRGFLGLEPLRLNSGLVFYKEKVTDSESDQERKRRDFFVSLTADFDLKSLIAPLAALLP